MFNMKITISGENIKFHLSTTYLMNNNADSRCPLTKVFKSTDSRHSGFGPPPSHLAGQSWGRLAQFGINPSLPSSYKKKLEGLPVGNARYSKIFRLSYNFRADAHFLLIMSFYL